MGINGVMKMLREKAEPGSCQYVMFHAHMRRRKGKGPTCSFGEERNPRKALQQAGDAFVKNCRDDSGKHRGIFW